MFLKFIALMHKAYLFDMILYDDVVRMYGEYWFVFYNDPVLKGEN